MRSILKICFVLAIAAVVFFALGGVQPATAQAVIPGTMPPIYNLYATDGYIELPDGGPLYMYGFVGGRQGIDFTFQNSCLPGSAPDPITGLSVPNCTGSVNTPVAGGPVAPSGGPWTAGDTLLAGNAQFPAPIVWATVGQPVEMRLKNLGVKARPTAPNDPHSIHLHGLDVDAANDGVPETSVGAVPANLCADGKYDATGACPLGYAPGAGNVIVYMFTPTKPGTYMYHCHQEADIHVQMGMYGALVVYNPLDPAAMTGPGSGVGGTLWGFQYDKDYIMLLSEFDVRGHQDEEGTYAPQVWDPNPYNWAQYKPQYWMINGLSFPNTIHVNFPSGYLFPDWLAAHPGYDPLITGRANAGVGVSYINPAWGTVGQKVLIRVINMGFETQPMHMHGYHGKILGSDQRAWDWANKPGNMAVKNPKPPTAFGLGLEKNTLTIGSGETYEWLVDFGLQTVTSTYAPGTQSCYDPLTNLPIANIAGCAAIPEAGAGPNIYIAGPTVMGAVGLGGTTQYFPFHNHDDYKATNNGVYPGGMFTMLVPLP